MKHNRLMVGLVTLFAGWLAGILVWSALKGVLLDLLPKHSTAATALLASTVMVPVIGYIIWYFKYKKAQSGNGRNYRGAVGWMSAGFVGIIVPCVVATLFYNAASGFPLIFLAILPLCVANAVCYTIGKPI